MITFQIESAKSKFAYFKKLFSFKNCHFHNEDRSEMKITFYVQKGQKICFVINKKKNVIIIFDYIELSNES